MSTELIPVADVERMARAVATSGLFGVKSLEQAMALMLIAQAEGLHPAIAARDYNIIQGRPALKSDAMLARFQSAGGKVKWEKYTDAEVIGVFSHPAGGEIKVGWSFQQATSIGLTTKDNWKKYPRAMLRARVISEAIRTIYPGCVVGVYTPEEIEDFVQEPTPPPKTEKVPAPVEVVGLDDSTVANHKANIDSAHTMEELKERYKVAYVTASRANDQVALKAFVATYEMMKAKLSATDVEPEPA